MKIPVIRAAELAAAASPGQFVMAVPHALGFTATALGVYEAAGDRVSVILTVGRPDLGGESITYLSRRPLP